MSDLLHPYEALTIHPNASAHLHKFHVFAVVPGKLLHPGVSNLERIVEIVDDGHLAAVIQQTENCMTACKDIIVRSTYWSHCCLRKRSRKEVYAPMKPIPPVTKTFKPRLLDAILIQNLGYSRGACSQYRG